MLADQSSVGYSVAVLVVLVVFIMEAASADPGHAPIGSPIAFGTPAREVVIKQYDHYFEPSTVTVMPREKIVFVITNRGTSVHEFMIGTTMMHRKHQQELQAMVDQKLIHNDHLDHEKLTDPLHSERPLSNRHHYDLSSALLEPGETKTLPWQFPHTGTIQFACNMPGHYQAGMVGDFQFDVSKEN